MPRNWLWAIAGILLACARVQPVLLPLAAVGALVAVLAWRADRSAPAGAAAAGLGGSAAALVLTVPVLAFFAWAGALLLMTPRPSTQRHNGAILVCVLGAPVAAALALQPWQGTVGLDEVLLAVFTLAAGRIVAIPLSASLAWTAPVWAMGALMPGAGIPLLLAGLVEGLTCWTAARLRLGSVWGAASAVAAVGVLAWP